MARPEILVINGQMVKPFPAGSGVHVVNGELVLLEEEAADLLLFERHAPRGVYRGVARGVV